MGYYRDKVAEYIADVVEGRRTAGKYERLAVQRHVSDLEKDWEFYFDEKAAARSCNFFRNLHHYQGELAGRPIELEGWEAFIVWSIFGWKRKSDGGRRFRYADVEVARKNGKTTLADGIALLMLVGQREMGAQVFSAAVDREQARICWEGAVAMVRQSPELSMLLKCYHSSIVYEDMVASFKPMSKDSKNKDGFNPYCSICDERHAWKTNEVYDVLRTGMGARKEPLIFSITTAGLNLSYPYFMDLRYLKNILDGTVKDEQQFVMIFELDADDDWTDDHNWCKANPNLGVSVSLDYMRGEFMNAKQKGGTAEVNFKTKNLNMWVDAPDVWIPDDRIAGNNHGTDPDSLLGKVCYAGMDFASHVDLNALALWFPEQKAVILHHWIPEGKVQNGEDLVDYRSWAADGWLHVTPGDVIDVDWIVADLVRIMKLYNVKCFAFDPYKAYHGIIQGLSKAGFDGILREFGQGIGNMSAPTREMERMLVAGEMDLLGNPVIRWEFGNVVIYRDPNDNIKMNKGKSINKIDGCYAMADAIGAWMGEKAKAQESSVPQGYTLRTVKNF